MRDNLWQLDESPWSPEEPTLLLSEDILEAVAPLPADPLEFLKSRQPRGRMRVLYEDEHLLLVNKPSNLLTQADCTGDPALPDVVRSYLAGLHPPLPTPIYCQPAHRLDRPVSGVVAVARSSKAFERLTTAFHDRKVQKVYWALVATLPRQSAGTLTHWLVRHETRNLTVAHPTERAGAWWSQLDYRVLGPVGSYWLLEVRPLTGRPHQIRVQLATGLGSPIVGDVKYGAPAPLPDFRIGLHARRLTIPHPLTGQPITAEAELPDGQPWRIMKA